jgi:hypothetical protein
LLTFLLLIVNSLLQKQKKQKPNYEKVINANTLYITDKEFSDSRDENFRLKANPIQCGSSSF